MMIMLMVVDASKTVTEYVRFIDCSVIYHGNYYVIRRIQVTGVKKLIIIVSLAFFKKRSREI